MLNIGISFGWKDGKENLFYRGIGQTALFIQSLLSSLPNVKSVTLLHFDKPKAQPPKGFFREDWDLVPLASIEEYRGSHHFDMLIDGMFYTPESMARSVLKPQTGKHILFEVSVKYLQVALDWIRPQNGQNRWLPPTSYDAVWMFPHVVETSKSMEETLLRCPVFEVPYIWDPFFC